MKTMRNLNAKASTLKVTTITLQGYALYRVFIFWARLMVVISSFEELYTKGSLVMNIHCDVG